ncbi:hypothetical protein PV327_000747 [Microctonus hyperodae]|uniref:Orc1-like AAA ATPase domain-containing protein n=1 Tax=Microctonus hyperodae TaxID=165561 RepID=A0AA39G7B1_MICHY|nr:hypothetical protein PV327_000747 [Microctonus hyperodae]
MNNRHFLRRDSFKRRRGPSAVKSSTDSHVEFTWTPELFGPLFGAEKITLWQALRSHLIDRRTKVMASFVPDELIYTLDLTKKYLNTFIGVVLLIDISSCHELWQQFCHMKNDGSYKITRLFNSQICSIIELIYHSDGDIINFESHGIMAMWKVRKFELAFKTIELVIKCALTIKEMSKNNNIKPSGLKLRMSISMGDVGFSIIGNDNGRHWILIGEPVENVRTLIKNCNAGDVILTQVAWEYISPNNYEYVLSDDNSIKIIGETGSFLKSDRKLLSSMGSSSHGQQKSSTDSENDGVSLEENLKNLSTKNEAHETSYVRLAIVNAVSRKLIDKLRNFLMPGLVDYIEKDRLLDEFCHNRRVTILSINIAPIKCTNLELLDLCDECFSNLFRLASEYSGRIETVIAHTKAIFFSVIFGPLIGDIHNKYKNGIICAEKCFKILNNIKQIKKLSIGVSTGVVLYTIVGNLVRHAYFCLGSPVDKSEKIVAVSNRKVSCDFDTVLYSDISRSCFRLRSTKGITSYGRFHIYELHNSDWTKDDHWMNRNIHEIYPIIGRFDEVEKFTDTLDEICSSERNYCGFIIEGPDGVGKSRLLDEFVMIAKSRQISTHKLSLNSYDIARSFNTIHRVLLNIMNAETCEIIEQRERICIKNFGRTSSSRKLCYFNTLMHVNFSLTQNFILENEENRVAKTLELFNKFLESIQQPSCIFLDNVNFIDEESWPYICAMMNHKNFFLVMTFNSSKCKLWQNNFFNDSRLYKCTLGGLNPEEIISLICQLLNVYSISKKFHRILKKHNQNNPGWCEILISLMLERKWLDFQYLDRKRNIKHLISPPVVSVAKVPYGIFPDEINHDVPYYKRRSVDINPECELFMNDHSSLSIVELYENIFSFLSPYEKNFLNTASILGDVFFRDTLEIVMPDAIEHETIKAIVRLIEARIIECASIQRFSYNFSLYTSRSTFSDMHHIYHCACYRTNIESKNNTHDEEQGGLPGYAHCKLFEFKAKDFRQFVYSKMSLSQQRNLHTIVAEIYERQAKRCNSCGGGSFFKTPNTSQTIGRPGSIMRQSISREIARFRRRKRSVSVSSQEAHDAARDRKISIRDEPDEETTSVPENNKRKLEKIFDVKNDPSRRSQLKKFNMIDFRNCECEKIILEIYMELVRHLEKLDDLNKLVKWITELAAGLIQIYRCTEAFKLLIIAKKHNENLLAEKQCTNIIIILGLMGDASAAVGNNSEARKYFGDVIKLQKNEKFFNDSLKVYNKVSRYWRRRFKRYFENLFFTKSSQSEISKRITIAHYLIKLSKLYLSEGEFDLAECVALNACNIGFSHLNEGPFIEKCTLHINAIIIFRTIGEWKFIQQLEKQIIKVMRKKSWWSNVDEILSVVHVFQLIFESRTLKGEYKNAYNIGIKILKISGTLHLTGVTLIILPLLIQLAIRMKRVYHTADLMGQLYYLSIEDIDESSITWYYSLALDLALDAGMALEPFEKSVQHAKTILTECKYKTCVSRDPESLKRLLTCLWIWQLRMGVTVTATFPQSSTSYANSIKANNHSQILTLAKGLGCYLLLLKHQINIKNSAGLSELLTNINLLLDKLEKLSYNAWFIKPRFYMLKAYLKTIHGDKYTAMKLLKKGKKCATSQGNQMMIAWILQCETTFRTQQNYNMAQYWNEHTSSADEFNWRNIHDFDVKAWSTILYPIPVPESCL